MNLFKTDQLFEQAGRSPESCEKLIKLQREGRVRCMIGVFLLLVMGLIFLSWRAVVVTRATNAEVKSLRPIAVSPTPGPVLEKIEGQHYTLTYPPVRLETATDFEMPESVTAILMAFLVFMALIMFMASLHHDACLKMLLILRAQQGLSSRRDARD